MVLGGDFVRFPIPSPIRRAYIGVKHNPNRLIPQWDIFTGVKIFCTPMKKLAQPQNFQFPEFCTGNSLVATIIQRALPFSV
jgi:hypothetical protein